MADMTRDEALGEVLWVAKKFQGTIQAESMGESYQARLKNAIEALSTPAATGRAGELRERLVRWIRPSTLPKWLPGDIDHPVVQDCADAADMLDTLAARVEALEAVVRKLPEIDQNLETGNSIVATAMLSDAAGAARALLGKDRTDD